MIYFILDSNSISDFGGGILDRRSFYPMALERFIDEKRHLNVLTSLKLIGSIYPIAFRAATKSYPV